MTLSSSSQNVSGDEEAVRLERLSRPFQQISQSRIEDLKPNDGFSWKKEMVSLAAVVSEYSQDMRRIFM